MSATHGASGGELLDHVWALLVPHVYCGWLGASMSSLEGGKDMHSYVIPNDMPLDAKRQYRVAVNYMQKCTEAERLVLAAQIERGKAEQQQPFPDGAVLEEARVARDLLVEDFQPLVMYMATVWQGRFRHLEWLDLVQEGNLAVLRMLDYYNLLEVVVLRGLAAACIRHAFYRLLYGDGVLHMPEGMVKGTAQLGWVTSHLLHALGREPTLTELAQAMGLSEQQVSELLQAKEQSRVESLQNLLEANEESDGDGGESYWHVVSLYPVEVVEDSRQVQAEALLWQSFEAVLTERQRQVVVRHWGLGEYEPRSYQVIAQEFGLSEGAVRGACADALKKLKRFLAMTYGEITGQVLEGYYTEGQAVARLGITQMMFRNFIRDGKITRYAAPGARYLYAQREIEALALARAQVAEQSYTLSQVMEKLGVCDFTIQKWVKQGKLRRYVPDGMRTERYARVEVDALVALRQGQEGVA